MAQSHSACCQQLATQGKKCNENSSCTVMLPKISEKSKQVRKTLYKAFRPLILEHPICPTAKNNHFLLYKRL